MGDAWQINRVIGQLNPNQRYAPRALK